VVIVIVVWFGPGKNARYVVIETGLKGIKNIGRELDNV